LSIANGGLSIVTGVTDPHLADEIYVQWAHVFNANIVTTLWGSVAVPGKGLRSLLNTQTEAWSAIGAIASFKY
jgi:hypothetical protein